MNLYTEDYERIEEAAANWFSVSQIAVILLQDPVEFEKAFNAPNSLIKKHFDKGRLESEYNSITKLRTNAEGGNLTAYQILEKHKDAKKIEALKAKILYGE